jgi:hypothetical protein
MKSIEQEEAAYAGGEDRPLRAFAGLMAAYATAVAGGALFVRRRPRAMPDRVSLSDIALLSVATFKIGRLVAKDPVTSPLRAPFTKFEGTTGPAELKEEVRGTGVRKAIGELLTCPFCVGQWVATALAFSLVLAPRATRLVATVFTCVTAADFLQFAYAATEEKATS